MVYGFHHTGAEREDFDQCEYVLLSMENVFQGQRLFNRLEYNILFFIKFKTVKTKLFFFQRIKILYRLS